MRREPADFERPCHNLIVALVEPHKRRAEARTPADRELYARQIEATDKEIDALVYVLRPKGVPAGEAGVGDGLTEEEIAPVEGEGGQRM